MSSGQGQVTASQELRLAEQCVPVGAGQPRVVLVAEPQHGTSSSRHRCVVAQHRRVLASAERGPDLRAPVPRGVRQRDALVEAGRGAGNVASEDATEAGAQPDRGLVLRRQAEAAAEHAAGEGVCGGWIPATEPVLVQTSSRRRSGGDIAPVARPVQRRAEVGRGAFQHGHPVRELGRQPGHPGPLGEAQVVAGVGVGDLVEQPPLRQSRLAERAQRLQHPVVPVRGRPHQQRCGVQLLEDRLDVRGRRGNRGCGVPVECTPEDRDAVEAVPLVLVQQPIAPADRATKAGVATRRAGVARTHPG